jgi:cell division septation protein DedD
MTDSAHWQASLSEHRAAWIIACCCIATIFIASTWPDLFSFEPTLSISENRQVKNQPPAQQQASSSTPKHEVSRTIKKETQQLSNTNKAKAVIRKIKPVINKEPQQQTPEKQPEKIAAAAGNYYVQAGAFKERTLARKLANRLKEHGWNAVIVPKSGFHAVWVGPKNSRRSIENLQKSIIRTLKIKGFIVQKEIS